MLAFGLIVISCLTACSMDQKAIPNPTDTAPSVTSRFTLTATPVSSSTQTAAPTPSLTPTPTASPTATFLPIQPVLQGTALPIYGAAISSANAERLTLLARWGEGNPGGVAYSPDGKYLIVGASTGLYFYDAGDFSLAHILDTESAIFSLAVSPDSQVVAVVVTGQVLLYQVSDFQLLKTISIAANSVDFSPDGKILALATGRDPNHLQMLDAKTGELLNKFVAEQAAWDVKVSPRGDYIATGGFSTTIWAFDGTITQQNGPYTSGGHTASVSFSPDGSLLAEGSDYWIRIWRVLENGRLIIFRELDLSRFNYASIWNVAISPDGKLVAATLSEGIYVWDIASGSRVFGQEVDYSFYNDLAWAVDSKKLVTASSESSVQIWNVFTDEQEASLSEYSGTLSAITWSSDGKILAVGAQESSAYLLNAENGSVIQHFGSGYYLDSLAFSPDDSILAIGYNDGNLQLWTMDGNLLGSLDGFGYGKSDATFSADGSFLAACSPSDWQSPPQVRLWNTNTWAVAQTFSVGDQDNYSITGFALAPNQAVGAISYVDMRSYDKDSIQIVSIADGTLLATLTPASRRYRVFIDSMSFSPNSAWLAVFVSEFDDPNPRVLVWQTSDWQLIYEQSMQRNGPRLGSTFFIQDTLAWSSDSSVLAVSMSDGSIQILDAENGTVLTTLPGHRRAVTGVAFSPDGRILASISLDGTIMLWGLR